MGIKKKCRAAIADWIGIEKKCCHRCVHYEDPVITYVILRDIITTYAIIITYVIIITFLRNNITYYVRYKYNFYHVLSSNNLLLLLLFLPCPLWDWVFVVHSYTKNKTKTEHDEFSTGSELQ